MTDEAAPVDLSMVTHAQLKAIVDLARIGLRRGHSANLATIDHDAAMVGLQRLAPLTRTKATDRRGPS